MILPFLGGYIAGEGLNDYMAEQRTLPGRDTTARREPVFRPLASDPVDIPEPPLTPRSIGSPRSPISRGDIPTYAPLTPRSIGTPRAPISRGDIPIYAPAGPPAGSQNAPTDGDTVGSFSDRFGLSGILADLFLRTFGADETDTPRPPIVVGDAGFAGASGGGNTAIIVLIIAGVAGAGYYFFVYKKGAQ